MNDLIKQIGGLIIVDAYKTFSADTLTTDELEEYMTRAKARLVALSDQQITEENKKAAKSLIPLWEASDVQH